MRKRQFEDAISIRVAKFTVGKRKAQRIVTAAARADDNLANSIGCISVAVRVLRRKSFVGMFMPRQDQRGVSHVEIPPEFPQLWMNGMTFEHAAAEERVMPVGEDASVGMRCQVLTQPLLLRRAVGATAQALCAAIRVQRHDVP